MIRFIKLAFLACVGCLYSVVAWAGGPEIGMSAPNFTLSDAVGHDVSLEDFKGKHVVLEWANYDCPFVRKHYDSQNMQTLQKTYTDQDVIWLTIISSAPGKQGYLEPEALVQRAAQEGSNASFLLRDPDGTVGKLYNAKTTPHMFVIDPQGILQYMGAIDSVPNARIKDIARAKNYVSTSLDALMAGAEVSPTSTPPYGCSVKYGS